MGLLFKRKQKKQGFVSHLTDLALVAGTGVAIARRQGWIPEDKATFLGSRQANMSLPQLIVVAGALLRVIRWFRGQK